MGVKLVFHKYTLFRDTHALLSVFVMRKNIPINVEIKLEH